MRTGERFPDVERRSYLPYGDYQAVFDSTRGRADSCRCTD